MILKTKPLRLGETAAVETKAECFFTDTLCTLGEIHDRTRIKRILTDLRGKIEIIYNNKICGHLSNPYYLRSITGFVPLLP